MFSFEGTKSRITLDLKLHKSGKTDKNKSGDNDAEDPPVPIPNTEVKLCSADDTWWETARESKSSPDFIFLNSSVGRAHDC